MTRFHLHELIRSEFLNEVDNNRRSDPQNVIIKTFRAGARTLISLSQNVFEHIPSPVAVEAS